LLAHTLHQFPLDELDESHPRPAFHTPSPNSQKEDENEEYDNGDEDDYFQFENDQDFVRACRDTEISDREMVYQRLFRGNINNDNFHRHNDKKHRLMKQKHHGKKSKNSLMKEYESFQERIGIQKLRDFLEETVDDTYRQNMARILPLLQNDYAATEKRLMQVDAELANLSIERLKSGADAFCDDFCVALRKAIQGSITAPASLFGETLQQEKTAGGSFSHISNSPMSVSDRTWDRLVGTEVGHASHRLYGGAQYHRTLREFNLATKCMRLPSISEDEIANAAGMGATHDGMNFLHAACVIALEKARRSLEPMLEALQQRVSHVFERLCPVTEYMLLQEFKSKSSSSSSLGSTSRGYDSYATPTSKLSSSSVMDISQNPQFRRLIRKVFESFVAQCAETTMIKCRDDLVAITRYVTWNLEDGTSSAGALRRALPDQTDLVAIYQVALQANEKGSSNSNSNPSITTASSSKQKQQHSSSLTTAQRPLQPVRMEDEETRDYYNLLQVMEEAISSRNTNRTMMVVGSLVQHIVTQWRDSFGRQVATKFNCFFLLPFVDDFHKYMRQSVQNALNNENGKRGGEGNVFDLHDARRELQSHRRSLTQACEANLKLQDKFQKLERMMRKDNDSTKSQGGGI